MTSIPMSTLLNTLSAAETHEITELICSDYHAVASRLNIEPSLVRSKSFGDRPCDHADTLVDMICAKTSTITVGQLCAAFEKSGLVNASVKLQRFLATQRALSQPCQPSVVTPDAEIDQLKKQIESLEQQLERREDLIKEMILKASRQDDLIKELQSSIPKPPSRPLSDYGLDPITKEQRQQIIDRGPVLSVVKTTLPNTIECPKANTRLEQLIATRFDEIAIAMTLPRDSVRLDIAAQSNLHSGATNRDKARWLIRMMYDRMQPISLDAIAQIDPALALAICESVE